MGYEGAQERATALLAEAASSPFGDLSAVPVDVQAMAEELAGLLVLEAEALSGHELAPDLPDGATLSGLLLPAQKHLLVDASEARRSEGRRRFTIAHELGHWYLHCADGAQPAARFCRGTDIGSDPRIETRPAIEREADAFAGALLMPEVAVRAESARVRCNVGLLARCFGVSRQAMRVRLDQLGLLPEYMR